MIRFDRVTKLYPGTSRPALDGVDVEIRAGEFVFLVGASGSGKSSFLRLILKEEKPTSGEIHVLGQRLGSISNRKVPYFRRNLGVVFQDFRLLPNRTVFQNVAFTLQVIGKSRGFIQQTVPDVLKTVGLAGKEERLPHELSGGEQQRVAIARAVVNKPAILLADEPTGNLDPATSQGIMQVLDTINLSGTTVVMATHDVGIVDAMKRRVIELVGGKIVRDETEGGYTMSIPIVDVDHAEVLGVAEVPAAVVAHSTPGSALAPETVRSWSLSEEGRVITSPVPVVGAGATPATTPVPLAAASASQSAARPTEPQGEPDDAPTPEAAEAATDQPEVAAEPRKREVVTAVDEDTVPRAELPLAARLREAAGARTSEPFRRAAGDAEPEAAPAAHADDALSLAVRLGLRGHEAEPESPSSQEIGPTS